MERPVVILIDAGQRLQSAISDNTHAHPYDIGGDDQRLSEAVRVGMRFDGNRIECKPAIELSLCFSWTMKVLLKQFARAK